jgi:hypothetical protein
MHTVPKYQFYITFTLFISLYNYHQPLDVLSVVKLGHAVAQWLTYCATNRKVAGSIPDGVSIFH